MEFSRLRRPYTIRLERNSRRIGTKKKKVRNQVMRMTISNPSSKSED
jgi:hypothetical protein